MRRKLKAQLIAECLQGMEPSEVVKHDPELRDLERLSSLLQVVSEAEPVPSLEAQQRIDKRVMDTYLLVSEGEKKRERDPSRRVSVSETWRYSYATLAAAALIALILVMFSVFLAGPGMKPVPPGIPVTEAEAQVFATGDVEVRAPGGDWALERTPLVLSEGSALRTPDGVRAEIACGGENLLRLDAASEAKVIRVGENEVAVELDAGQGYFRAQDGTAYSAVGGGLDVETLGTVFNISLAGDNPELLALQHAVRTGAPALDAGTLRLEEGKMLTLPQELGEGGLAGQVSDIPPERLQDEWLVWNASLDASRGWDVGMLAGVEPAVAQVPQISPLGETESPNDGEEGEDGETGQPSIALQGAVQEGGVGLSWELRDGTAQDIFVLRAMDREPVYPEDVLVRLAGDALSYRDGNTQPGMSYTYRVAIEHDGQTIYSNAMVANIPEINPEIILSGRVVDGGKGMPVIEISWRVEGNLQADYFELVRGEMDQVPVFPPYGSMLSWRFNTAGPFAYTDGDLYMGYTYNYRVFAIRGGQIVLDSNIVSLYVDTTVILDRPQ